MTPPDADAGPRRPEEDEPLRFVPVTEEVPDAAPQPLPMNWFSPLHAVRRRRRAFDPHRPSHWVAGAAVTFVLGLVLSNLAYQVYLLITGGEVQVDLSGTSIVVNLLINMALFIGGPVLWVWVMYYDGAEALRERLFLQSTHVGKDLLVGLGAGLLGLLVSYTFILIFIALGLETENPVVEDLSLNLTWALVFFIPFAAATSEEIFFRAWLQPRIGVVGANVFFGFVHLSYQTPLQVLVPMALGFILSWTLVRRRSVLPAITAHFVFNFAALALTKLASDYGWLDTTAWAFL